LAGAEGGGGGGGDAPRVAAEQLFEGRLVAVAGAGGKLGVRPARPVQRLVAGDVRRLFHRLSAAALSSKDTGSTAITTTPRPRSLNGGSRRARLTPERPL